MAKTAKLLRFFSACALIGLLFGVTGVDRLAAQVVTATISGTATDSSGAALVGASIEAKNVGTNATQSTVSDAAGRYRIADLPIGGYEVHASMSGFQTVVHKGITLTVGANLVVDFSLPVGQVSQTVSVEGEVSRVETQTAAVSSLVTPQQMSQLPLNGRNFEQLLSLAPGVQAVTQTYITGGGGGGLSSGFYGPGSTYSVAGSRPVGQVFLLDNQDLQGYWNKGTGSNVTGNSLGVDAIQEFQVLTNTYSAQFGGTGAAVNAASTAGTNALHGVAYEYLRNSALDARDFFDGTKIPPFRRNQFGGSLGGPIKKDKLFFFVNYEGLSSALGITGNQFVPDALSRTGSVPCNTVTGQTTGTCANGQRKAVPVSALIAPYLAAYPDSGVSCVLTPPSTVYPGPCQLVTAGPFVNYPTGNALVTTIAKQPENENYVLGRMDYTLGSKDSLFGRYISDTAYLSLPVPFSNLPKWPVVDHGGDQFFNLEEKHIISPTEINEIRFSFSRTNERADQDFLTDPASDPLQFYLQHNFTAPSYTPGQREDGNLIIAGGTSPIGPGATARFHLIENKFTGGDDLSWTKGAHTLSMGLWVTRIQDNIAVGREGGIFVFGNLPGFLNAAPVQFQGEANPFPGFNRTRYSRAVEYFPYIQDDWKVRSNLTLNIGLRYDFETNPICFGAGFACTNLLNPLSSPTFTAVHHVLQSNPNVRNFDPRIGVAWDPFSDHKTSIRAGFGIFHEQLSARTYLNAYSEDPPTNTVVLTGPGAVALFPNPAFCAPACTPVYGAVYGLDYRASVSPYAMQYNLTVQRDLGHGMVASIGYVGAQGVHLYSQRNYNTRAPIDAGGNPCTSSPGSPCFFKGLPVNPAFCFPVSVTCATGTALGLDFTAPSSHSTYNGLVASLTRQITRNLQGQVSYTWSRAIDNGSASSGLEQSAFEINDVFNQAYDRGPASFNVDQSLRINSVYTLPFHGNRLVSGWQVSEILSAATGFPVNVLDGLTPQQANTGGITGDRPDVVAGCNPYQISSAQRALLLKAKLVPWFNPSCFAIQPAYTLGNAPRDSLVGPGLLDLDFSIIKQTKLTEKLNTEFRAEFFNIINHTNLGQPVGAVFAGTSGTTPPFFTTSVYPSGTAGVVTSTATTSRQIQFALKLLF
ncbi:MAG TPA: carboxypeptidase regulatory-like domain-containing protein [Candidatus Acidoferrales bacterium]|nr:carboxypeptidase regulatory-like domain-containing protein [Candidatus Acidoferrales bacterium]